MTRETVTLAQQQTSTSHPLSSGILQHNCLSCGQHTILGGECEECREKNSLLQRHPTEQAKPSQQFDVGFQLFKESRFQSDFSRTPIQPKLQIAQPNDKYEQEANLMADQVMRQQPPQATQKLRKQEKLQRKTETDQIANRTIAIGSHSSTQAATAQIEPSNHPILGGSGIPLPSSVRTLMETGFQREFSDVRIHTDSVSAQNAAAMGARAFTFGNHVAFNKSQFAPNTERGKRLIAHELAHVMQNSESHKSHVGQTIRRAPPESEEGEKKAESQWEDDFFYEEEEEAIAEIRVRKLKKTWTNARKVKSTWRGKSGWRVQKLGPQKQPEKEETSQDKPKSEKKKDKETKWENDSQYPTEKAAKEQVKKLKKIWTDARYQKIKVGEETKWQVQRLGPKKKPKICKRASTKVSGFPDPHISQIDIDLGNLSSGLSITWSRETTETRALRKTFPISPGAGLCTTCCDDFNKSRKEGSLCTPKGKFQVDYYKCVLDSASWATNGTFFAGKIRTGIAIHTGPRPGFPASHGCVRTTKEGSTIIYDNSRSNGDTAVHVTGTWSGSRCYKNIKQKRARPRRGSEKCSSSAQLETPQSQTRFAQLQPREEPIDGAGPA